MRADKQSDKESDREGREADQQNLSGKSRAAFPELWRRSESRTDHHLEIIVGGRLRGRLLLELLLSSVDCRSQINVRGPN